MINHAIKKVTVNLNRLSRYRELELKASIKTTTSQMKVVVL